MNDKKQPSVLDALQKEGDVKLEDVMKIGFGGIKCVESGGPEPEVSCAGRIIITSIGLLENLGTHLDDSLLPSPIISPCDPLCSAFPPAHPAGQSPPEKTICRKL